MRITMLRSLGGRSDRVEGRSYDVDDAEGNALIAAKLAYNTASPGDLAPAVVEVPLNYVWDVSGPTAQPHPDGVGFPKFKPG